MVRAARRPPGAAGAGVGAAVCRGLSDRHRRPVRSAAESTGSNALGLELAGTDFDASVLSEFRTRLAADDQAERLLHRMLASGSGGGVDRAGPKPGRPSADATTPAPPARWLVGHPRRAALPRRRISGRAGPATASSGSRCSVMPIARRAAHVAEPCGDGDHLWTEAFQQVILRHGDPSSFLDLVVRTKDASPLCASGDEPRCRYIS
jgi:hypothetical protein